VESDLPWLIAAVREALAADAPFWAACHGRLSERAPSEVSIPYAIIQIPTSMGDMGGGVYRPMVQVDGWCPGSGYETEEASVVVWRIATRANRVLKTLRNRQYQTMHFSARATDLMPLPADTSRGDSTPMAHAMARAILTIHNI
jgi:hypothetical protein